MAYLFEVKNNSVVPTAEALMIAEFKEIWDTDKSADKTSALNTFAYIEFMTSALKSNPYQGYPAETRQKHLGKLYLNDENYEPKGLIKEAINIVNKFQTEASTAYSYYLSHKKSAEMLKNHLEEIDLTERNEKTGNMLYKPKDITSALVDTNEILDNILKLEEKVNKELYGKTITKVRAGKEVSVFAKKESFNV
jgi:hypothetical protein